MSNKPWSPFYWGDYVADTGHLSLAQHGAYLLLMAHYYRTGRPIPANAEQVHRICRCITDADQCACDEVLGEFFILDGDVYRHDRVEKELAKATEISEVRRAAANVRHQKTPANAPALAPAKADASALQMHTQSQSQSQSQSQPQPQLQPESQNTISPEPGKPASGRVLVTLPCVGNGPKEFGVTRKHVDEWQECFPGVDVIAQVRQARAWLDANPTRRKTCKGMPRFIVGWLDREQNSNGNGRGNHNGHNRGQQRQVDNLAARDQARKELGLDH